VPAPFGTSVVTVAATKGTATGYARRTVVSEFITGTTVLDVTDPDGDDNGPGTYAYPTSDDFKPGAFDLQRFQVIVDGDNVLLRAKVRDLSPDVRLTDRRPAARPVRAHADRGNIHGRGVPVPELHDRGRFRLDPADRGAGLRRPGVRRRVRRAARHRCRCRPARRPGSSR
jgi:hypothetical protein